MDRTDFGRAAAAVGRLATAARAGSAPVGGAPIVDLAAESETLDPRTLAFVLALGGAAMWVSERASHLLAAVGLNVPSILIITALALALTKSLGREDLLVPGILLGFLAASVV